MNQAEIIAAIAAIRGAEMAPSKFDAERASVHLAGREIAHAQGEGVDVRLSRARLIAAGLPSSALMDCRQEWTLLDPVPVSAAHLNAIVQIFTAGPGPIQPASAKRTRR
jgi:hypothetical protein